MRTGISPLGLLFGCTLFTSSALIFFVQPMFAKMVLPQLGGSPSVWNTCVVFFQAALLAGYAYAHLMTRFALRTQVAVHALFLAAAACALPIAMPLGWLPPTDGTPVPWLLALLGVVVGGPFLVASASAPLLQRWFSLTGRPSSSDPYFFYATSNVGSLVSLLAYPFVVEPSWTLTVQSTAWTFGFVTLGLLIIACGVAAERVRVTARAEVGAAGGNAVVDGAAWAEGSVTADSRHSVDEVPRRIDVTWRRRAHWLALSAVPSSLMLSVTTYLSTDIAAVPLLWILPLTCYLLSFVVAFAPRSLRHGPLVPANLPARIAPLLICCLVLFMLRSASSSLAFIIPLHLLAFLAIAVALHLELTRTRPAAEHLTEFYLWLAVGGVVGGSVNAFLAPVLFSDIAEYPIGLVAACLLLPRSGGASGGVSLADIWWPVVLGVAAFATARLIGVTAVDPRLGLLLAAPLVLWCLSFSRRPVRFALAVTALLVVGQFTASPDGVLLAERSFFGVHRVTLDASGRYHGLSHGTTLHGQQSLDPARRREPLSYYHVSGPIGQTLAMIARRHEGARVAVIGLGAGTLASHARSGQQWTFYEIDPVVERIAREPRFFTYLSDCGDTCRVVLGDARVSLANAAEARYNLVVLDAFSSDAIPIHLLTRDAIRLYLSRLDPQGVIAFHISNRHLALRPVLGDLAADLGLVSIAQAHRVIDVATGQTSSEWLLMARTSAALGGLATDRRWEFTVARRGARVWTDEYSNIVAALTGR
jgi:hypothetical protein